MPMLVCEWPSNDGASYVHNEVHVRGWALGAERVVVEFGELTADARVGLDSSDLAGRFPSDPRADRARFELELPAAGCARGIQGLNVVAILADGGELRAERTITVEPYDPPGEATAAAINAGAIVMSCDTPQLGDTDEVSSPVRISGWCYARSGVDRVEAFIDGTQRFDLVFPSLRRDVWKFFGLRDALLSGFDLLLDLEDCPPGTHSLSILVTTTDGRTVGQSGKFVCFEVPADSTAVEAPSADHAEQQKSDGLPGSSDRDRAGWDAGAQSGVESRARYRWAAPLAVGRTVLDAGCGPGDGTAMLAREGAARAVGVDVHEAVLAEARTRYGESAEFLVADLSALPFAHDEFDLVVAFGAIEHVPQRTRVLDELHRVLRSHGVLLVSSNDEGMLGELRDRWRHVRRWGQQTFVTAVVGELAESTAGAGRTRLETELPPFDPLSGAQTAFVLACASDAPLPDIPGIAVLGEAGQLQALLDELDHMSLRALVAERHAVVSTLESDVIQKYHQELLRSHAALNSQLAACLRARDSGQPLAAAADNDPRSASGQLTWLLRAASRIGRRGERR